MTTEYTIKIETPEQRTNCEVCENQEACQYFIEIFDHHSNYRHLIRGKRLINYVAEICKHYKSR